LGIGLLFASAILSSACSQTGKQFTSPAGYDLNHPQKIIMPESLHEISGIAFYKGNPDTVYAEQDENGKLFYLHPGDKNAAHFKFGKSGDYEDVAICGETVIMLRSNGALSTFPLSDIHQVDDASRVKEQKNLLPQGEYEGLYADEANRLLYVLCKHCLDEKTSKIGKGYILQLADDGSLSQHGDFSYSVKDIEAMSRVKKVNFHPSALGNNPLTKEWYIVSSVNKMLVVADANWAIKAVHNLNAAIYIQPEGIAFDKQGNLYISNEGGDIHAGNILKIPYRPKK
jgi:hypothetical protein